MKTKQKKSNGFSLEDYMSGKTDGMDIKNKILGNPTSIHKDLKITFITPQVISSKSQIRRVQPPLGIACLAAVLEEYGYNKIQLIDASAEGYDNIVDLDDGFVRFGLDNNIIKNKLDEFKPDVIGISALFSSQIGCSFELSKMIKESLPDSIIILGGIHATKMAKKILIEENSIDYIIAGEADYTFTLLCEKILLDDNILEVPGLVYRDNKIKNKIIQNPQLPGLNMNELPLPAWHLMDMDLYYDIGMPHNPFMESREFITVMTERGCPEKCYFCSSGDFFGDSGKFRPLTPENVYEMLKYGVDKYNIKELQIEDDTFTLNSKRVIEICKLIAPLNLRITLPNSVRADAPMNHKNRLEMFQYMFDAGFVKLGISAEHGDQKFLDEVVGKRLNLDEVIASVELAHEAGLLVHTNFMMGFPFEEQVHRTRTINFAKSLKSDSFSVSLAAPLPGTKMWDICEKNNLFMPGFDVNRLVYDVVNIIPHDISPEGILKLVIKLNTELNSAARKRSKAAEDHYKLFEGKGKNASGDRKYSYKTPSQ
jgi:magnesium-protoporphyrin IX monomethyl ester (oxidative) cyclase